MSALAGQRVLVTRAEHQAGELADALRRADAVPLMYPCISIRPPADVGPLDEALRRAAAGGFDWMILTSANTVIAVEERLRELKLSLPKMRTIAIGPATAEATRKVGVAHQVETVPDDHSAEGLLGHIDVGFAHPTVFLPQSALADDTLKAALDARGYVVTAVEAYRTTLGRGGVDLPALLRSGGVDAVTVTSGSAATNLIRRIEAECGDVALLRSLPVACIGNKTAAAARAAGLNVVAVAEVQTVEALVRALADYLERKNA